MTGHADPVSTAYVAVGGNRQTAAADWSDDGSICFGAGINLAVWTPTEHDAAGGVVHLLRGHQGVVKAVQCLPGEASGCSYVVSGGDDNALKLWAVDGVDGTARCVQTVEAAHAAPVNCIAVPKQTERSDDAFRAPLGRKTIFATGGADATVKVWLWQKQEDGDGEGEGDGNAGGALPITLLQTINTQPHYLPLCLALVPVHGPRNDTDGSAWLLAAAGTSNRIQIFSGMAGSGSATTTTSTSKFALQATLTGHEDWIRSLDFGWERNRSKSSSNSSSSSSSSSREDGRTGDLLLASASQDKYIRLWRLTQQASGKPPATPEATVTGGTQRADPVGGLLSELTDRLPGKSPANKAHTVHAGDADYALTFEALLLGHDDWIYSAKWDRENRPWKNDVGGGSGSETGLRLLSASADNSLAIWEADASTGLWVTTARLGELSKEKGATTATGSVGGFWTGLWSPSGGAVATLCRTGSWRRWVYCRHRGAEGTGALAGRWVQAVGTTGHVGSVTGVTWARDGSYLLSTSSDQTTRLHAEWRRQQRRRTSNSDGDGNHQRTIVSWHEMARPQIHGYDLNCIDALGDAQFVSGADEKLLRVFHEPKTVARLVGRLTGRAVGNVAGLPDAANMPVLGLSNKEVEGEGEGEGEAEGSGVPEALGDAAAAAAAAAAADMDATMADDHPPYEDVLARNTLWPEIEKLYGHGYEISCLAVSHDGRLVASACRASSLNHAVVRLVETARWTEVAPPLAAHTLTVTRLRFSADDRCLLSVGRDRQWAVFERDDDDNDDAETAATAAGATGSPPLRYHLRQAEPKAHARMLLDCAWAPAAVVSGASTRVFSTAGRDKNVKVWVAPASSPLGATTAAEDSDAEGKPANAHVGTSRRFSLAATLPQDGPVTAVDFLWRPDWPPPAPGDGDNSRGRPLTLAIGTEGGRLAIVSLDRGTFAVSSLLALDTRFCLPKAVLQLAWRPAQDETAEGGEPSTGSVDLAVAGEDASLRVYRFHNLAR
ncbi:RNA polymerase 2 elongator [Niveomyces insectorum RCEF 264]|uniref:Elongator complex protein 2 n=1 Tax=Niveomyces insectorum RCEF 264 TaxID=1081102 RepID=A0A167ULQ5_9HYPO|nr:RNA polymerase 2 elongator [Niveomyces insectorum RCEF 264]